MWHDINFRDNAFVGEGELGLTLGGNDTNVS